MNTIRVVVLTAIVIVMAGCSRSGPVVTGSGFTKCKPDVPVAFTISLVDGVIKVDPDNGDAHVASDRVLRWTSSEQFELLFMLQEKKPGSEPGDLPVREKKPTTEDLCYRVGKKEYTMKYNIYVGTAKLDPTIIVDR